MCGSHRRNHYLSTIKFAPWAPGFSEAFVRIHTQSCSTTNKMRFLQVLTYLLRLPPPPRTLSSTYILTYSHPLMVFSFKCLLTYLRFPRPFHSKYLFTYLRLLPPPPTLLASHYLLTCVPRGSSPAPEVPYLRSPRPFDSRYLLTYASALPPTFVVSDYLLTYLLMVVRCCGRLLTYLLTYLLT